ncbi:hypothetical protein NJB95_20505 [Brucella intermedia]|uniref:hypothetical protein n=1 Tax=Brucella intermedia TaxID=94625 RepID=UPI00124EBBFE|nr:hypothetical protein [Brucella intermedia]KAB2700309.1 hypothetical protein F9K79_05285 [Ochrobactrum sp. Kaboul]MCO7738967.1 hypothetical protein [Brucella intermedia]
MSFESNMFPGISQLISAKRAPIIFRPFIGSPEQLVVGVVTYCANGMHIERANRLERLSCLFGEEIAGAVLAIEVALDQISETAEVDLLSMELIADSSVSAVSIGTSHGCQGKDLKQMAVAWLSAMSALYVAIDDTDAGNYSSLGKVVRLEVENSKERLPGLILEYVSTKRPSIRNAFSDEIRDGKLRRRTGAHGIIDFSGNKIVANFGTLNAQNHASSIDRIKRRMWDLKVDRDSEKGAFLKRNHEMLVQHPPANDPQLSQKQVDKIHDSIAELERQADQEEIRLRPMHSVAEIGEHLITAEAA